MPLIKQSAYTRTPLYMLNGHWETVIPSVFFKIKGFLYTSRERLELTDSDFIDLDWVQGGNDRCVVLSHGLEGDSGRYYMKRTARYFHDLGWDIAAWNCRSCSGQMNRLTRFYHHGDTADLNDVVNHVLNQGYKQVVLIGYSMGGSMSLKYLGEEPRDDRVLGTVVFSVPCNLKDSAVQLTRRGNQFYEKRFVKKLVRKIKLKAELGNDVDIADIDSLIDFDTFHDRYTAPLHGFRDREDFFRQSTCDQFLSSITVPTLIVNALNDPMLGDLCYPYDLARKSKYVYLETPKRGGHVGFTLSRKAHSFMELRAESFINEHLTRIIQ